MTEDRKLVRGDKAAQRAVRVWPCLAQFLEAAQVDAANVEVVRQQAEATARYGAQQPRRPRRRRRRAKKTGDTESCGCTEGTTAGDAAGGAGAGAGAGATSSGGVDEATSASDSDTLPAVVHKIALVGSPNVGKSSLIK